jgi:hypothetical protein
MDLNPKTGKGWTDAEEATFADIMRIGALGRMAAIRLFRRCKSNPAMALKLAAEQGERKTASTARVEKLRRLKEARFDPRKGACAARTRSGMGLGSMPSETSV